MILKGWMCAAAAFGALGLGAASGTEATGYIPRADAAAFAGLGPGAPPVGCESGVPAPFRACPDTAATLAARRAPGPAEVTGTVPHDPAYDALLRQLADRARAELLQAGPGAL